MALFGESVLTRYVSNNYFSAEDVAFEHYIEKSISSQRNFSNKKSFDVFLSHRYEDRKLIGALAAMLEEVYGLSVYVDWIDDSDLNRKNVTPNTADILRDRMRNSRCLFYATSKTSSDSRWMPWELGFMDGYNGYVAICPLTGNQYDDYKGTEYLGLYPYVSYGNAKETGKDTIWINETANDYKTINAWLNGVKHG